MDFDPEFPVPSYREREAISHYLKIEQEFMPHRAFYTQSRNAHLRLIAVKTVVQVSDNPRCFFFLFRFAVMRILNACMNEFSFCFSEILLLPVNPFLSALVFNASF